MSAAGLAGEVANAAGSNNTPSEKSQTPISLAFSFGAPLPNSTASSLYEVEEQYHFSKEATRWERPCLWWGARLLVMTPRAWGPCNPHLFHFPHLSSRSSPALAGCLEGSQTSRNFRKILQGLWEAAIHWIKSTGLWILIVTVVRDLWTVLTPTVFILWSLLLYYLQLFITNMIVKIW